MDHLKQTRDAFTRQADTFDAYAPKADERLAERLGRALDDSSSGTILDLACGPGVVTAAIAGAAAGVVAIDATPAMLEKAAARCRAAGHDNVEFREGDVESLPFGDASFDAAVTRLAIHHFRRPAAVLAEVFRVLRPGGRLVVVDVVAAGTPEEAALQNGIERLRDPSHVEMVSASTLDALVERAGFEILDTATWDKPREFEEWMGVANDPGRTEALGAVVRALAGAGLSAGMGLRVDDGAVVFFHRWRLVSARRA